MAAVPNYSLRQIYYFLLERPEINKKNNMEKIQDFFHELGIACHIDQRIGIKFNGITQGKNSIDPFNLPNFLNEKDFIDWVSKLLDHKKLDAKDSMMI